ncbi:ATP-binding protein [Candidatus Halobeggiatoa sp. HSG11]|nr:ATP-binding protein [Candidatus Halobeggiatoa sp. HSG11]
MKLLPSSLFGRLVLVLLVGLLLAQVLSTIILFKDRHWQIAKLQEKHITLHMIEITRMLDSLSEQKRDELLVILNTLHLQVSWQTEPSIDCVPDNYTPNLKYIVDYLKFKIGKRSLCMVEKETYSPNNILKFMGLEIRLHRPFYANIQLRDGNWVTFEHIHPVKEDVATPWRLILSLIVMIGIVLSLSLLAVHWVTRPLAFLTEAAEHLGRNIHHPPLSENCPIELRRAIQAFNLMQIRLTRYLEDRTRVMIAISHDLKTPITRLRLRIEQFKDDNKKAFIKDLDEMQTMIDCTLDFMRGLNTVETAQPLDILALIESLQADYEEMDLPLKIVTDYVPPPYPCNPQALKRCLVNLIDNAHKYATKVTISLTMQDKQLYIIIADRGNGIPEIALETVFEPFFRLEKSRSRETGGTGLGLSIARNIALAHGGDVILRNRAKGGLEAIVSLPYQ